MILSGVAKCWLAKKGHEEDYVDFAVRGDDQVKLLNNLDVFNKVYEIRRFPHPHLGNNCVRTSIGWETLDARKEKYDVVVDFVNSVENNSMHHALAAKYGEWMSSQNSNFQNWFDLSLGWCKIDPTTVASDLKRPLYKVEKSEASWAEKTLGQYKPLGLVIGMNMFASSRARTYFNQVPIVNELLEEYPSATVVLWNGNSWSVIRKGGSKDIPKPSIRASAALLTMFDIFICADSGFSHIAEAIGVPSITIYTTVPAWTRNKYYKHSNDIDIQLECKPCFTLHSQCPINRRRALEGLTEREQQILNASNQNIPLPQASNHFNTSPDKLTQEHSAILQKLDSYASIVPDCIASITPDMIVDKVVETLSKAQGTNGTK